MADCEGPGSGGRTGLVNTGPAEGFYVGNSVKIIPRKQDRLIHIEGIGWPFYQDKEVKCVKGKFKDILLEEGKQYLRLSNAFVHFSGLHSKDYHLDVRIDMEDIDKFRHSYPILSYLKKNLLT